MPESKKPRYLVPGKPPAPPQPMDLPPPSQPKPPRKPMDIPPEILVFLERNAQGPRPIRIVPSQQRWGRYPTNTVAVRRSRVEKLSESCSPWYNGNIEGTESGNMATIEIFYDENGNIVDGPVGPAGVVAEREPTRKEEEDIISLKEFYKLIPNEEAAVAFVEGVLWGDEEPDCPHCGHDSTYRVKSGKPLSHRCRRKSCKKYFSFRHGTLMYGTNLATQDWLLAIHLMHTARKGVSSLQMHKMLGTHRTTAWFLDHRVREAMNQEDMVVSGVVEIDETYVGGKVANMHNSKRAELGSQFDNKFIVVGMKERNGNVIAFPVPNGEYATLFRAVLNNVEPGTMVYTDGHPAYAALNQVGYGHDWVNHSAHEYVRGQATTNGIESFWALLDRAYVGTFHWMSWQHLHRYVNEAAYRLNSGSGNGPRTIAETVRRMADKHLPYDRLIGRKTYWQRRREREQAIVDGKSGPVV